MNVDTSKKLYIDGIQIPFNFFGRYSLSQQAHCALVLSHVPADLVNASIQKTSNVAIKKQI